MERRDSRCFTKTIICSEYLFSYTTTSVSMANIVEFFHIQKFIELVIAKWWLSEMKFTFFSKNIELFFNVYCVSFKIIRFNPVMPVLFPNFEAVLICALGMRFNSSSRYFLNCGKSLSIPVLKNTKVTESQVRCIYWLRNDHGVVFGQKIKQTTICTQLHYRNAQA